MNEQLSDDHELDRQELAVRAGLLYRLGPTDQEINSWPAWKRIAVRFMPRSQRWRLSPLAPIVKHYLSKS